MRAGARIFLKVIGCAAVAVAVGVVTTRISSHRSPTIDILGSYFPAWMICIVIGLALTFIAHWTIQVCGLRPYFGPAPLVYPFLMVIFTFVSWILLYRN